MESTWRWFSVVALLMLLWAGTAIKLVEARHQRLFAHTIYYK